MTIQEYRTKLESYLGVGTAPADFREYWNEKMNEAPTSICIEPVPFVNTAALYENVTLIMESRAIRGRCIRPNGEGPYPLVLMFHDLNRELRGWHHMTRFIAMGYAVIALDAPVNKEDWKCAPENISFNSYIQDALVLANYARKLSWVDNDKIVTWGEGLGGGLAIAAASMLPEDARCCALNPMPGDIRSIAPNGDVKLDYCDIAHFASGVRGAVLMGVCLMDQVAPPEGQYAAYNRMTCPKHMKVYPKYIHERVNAFENEFLAFLHT